MPEKVKIRCPEAFKPYLIYGFLEASFECPIYKITGICPADDETVKEPFEHSCKKCFEEHIDWELTNNPRFLFSIWCHINFGNVEILYDYNWGDPTIKVTCEGQSFSLPINPLPMVDYLKSMIRDTDDKYCNCKNEKRSLLKYLKKRYSRDMADITRWANEKE